MADRNGNQGTAAGNVAEIPAGGPICLTGRIVVEVGGEVVAEGDDLALCRCGESSNKPFCDGSHNAAGFDDPGVIQGGALAGQADSAEDAAVVIACSANGPLLVKGPLTVMAADGKSVQGMKGALCRCGQSALKPFCDGSHRGAGFRAE